MKTIQEKLRELEILISEERDNNDSPASNKIHKLISEAAALADCYPEENELEISYK